MGVGITAHGIVYDVEIKDHLGGTTYASGHPTDKAVFHSIVAHGHDYERNVTADKQALLKEWGGGSERMFNAATTAANALGFTQEMVDAIENAVGYGSTMKFFAGLGQKLSEDGFVSGDNNRGGAFSDTLTPQEAKAQWDAAKLDPNFQKALFDASHPGHAAAKDRQAKLFSIMYPS